MHMCNYGSIYIFIDIDILKIKTGDKWTNPQQQNKGLVAKDSRFGVIPPTNLLLVTVTGLG